MKTLKTILVCLLCSIPLIVSATQYESLAELRGLVRGFLQSHISTFPGERTEIQVSNLNSRLKLPKCNSSIKVFFPPSNHEVNSTTVGLSCPGPKPWKIYVPVHTKIFTQVVVAAQNLPKGQIIKAENLRFAEANRSHLRNGYYKNKSLVIGKVANRPLKAGRIITPKLVKSPTLVKRGQLVMISAKSGTVHVEMEGIAKQSAGLNDRIKVYNRSSKRLIEAVVVGPGRVQVPM